MSGTKETSFPLRFKLSPIPVQVLVDSVQIQQVMVNLIRSAVDALQAQSVREISMSTRVSATEE